MQLPPPLRAAVDRALEGVSSSELTSAAQKLSDRYRAEVRDDTPHLANEQAALAYPVSYTHLTLPTICSV